MRARLPTTLSGHWPDVVERDARARDAEVIVEAQGWTDSVLFAEGRLLQWAKTRAARGDELVVELGWRLPGIDDAPEDPRWEQLRESLAAHVLLRFAHRVTDASCADRTDEIAQVQAAALRQGGGTLGRGNEHSVVVDSRFGVQPPRLFNVRDDVGYAGQRVRSMLRRMGLTFIVDVDAVVTFVREAVENTSDHATSDLEDRPVSGLRFLQIRRIGLSQHQPEGLAATTAGSAVAAYLERMRAVVADDERRFRHFVEVTIADCGIGIAGRLYGNEDIYDGPLAAELEVLLRATRRDESSKAASVAGRGQGLSKIRDASAELRGVVVVRSGRHELVADSTEPSPPGQEGWHVTEHPRLRGTSVSVLLPWWDPAQQELMHAAQQQLIP